jgi:hypothetical protein
MSQDSAEGMQMAQDGSDWTEPGLFTVAPGVHRIRCRSRRTGCGR